MSESKKRSDGDWVILFGGLIGAGMGIFALILFRELLLGTAQAIISAVILTTTDVFKNKFHQAKNSPRAMVVLAIILVAVGGGVGGILVIFGIIINFIDMPLEGENDEELDEEY